MFRIGFVFDKPVHIVLRVTEIVHILRGAGRGHFSGDQVETAPKSYDSY